MSVSRAWVLIALISLALSACAPSVPVSGQGPGSEAAPAQLQAPPNRTLVLVAQNEPAAATPRVDLSGGSSHQVIDRLFTAGLAFNDEREVPRPYLSETLPQLNSDTWRVSADGTMETTYRLKPNLTWHDGKPLTAEDFAFAYRLYMHPDITGMFELNPQQAMTDVVAVDDRTILFRWKRPYYLAGSLSGGKTGFPPMPRHILEQPMLNDPATVPAHPFWTREHVSVGPYRLDRWEPGAFIEGVAFDQHALGRPKIDRVRLIWIADPNAAMANLLSGNATAAMDSAIGFQQAMLLRRQWEPQKAGTVYFESEAVRYAQIQARAEYANPRAVLDVRVRRALAHAIDKQAMVDGVLDGEGAMADTIVSTETEYYPTLDKMLAKYPFDPRRTEQLLNEAGIVRGPNGMFVGADGEPFAPEVRGPIENELAILVDSWRRVGIDAVMSVTPAALANNNEYRSHFPAFAITRTSLPEETATRKYNTADAATAENRWGGTNKGGYSHPDYDRLYAVFERSLDRAERNDMTMQMMKFASEQVPSLPMYYELSPIAHATSLQGPMKGAPASLGLWNIHLWEWR